MANYQVIDVPIQHQNDLYYLYKVLDQKGKHYYAHVFTIAKLQKYNVYESIEFNEEVFTDLDQYAFPQHFLKIKLSIPNQKYFTFLTQPYEENLQNYIKKSVIQQNEALKIFDQVLKAIYSLYTNGYWHKNIRLQHFVKVGKKWKLKSSVYTQINLNKQLKSEYVWYQSHQPPQAYEQSLSKFDDQDFYPVVVWNLGSILLDLIFSVHKLKNFGILKKFKNTEFSFEAIGIKNKKLVSNKLESILNKMLHYNSLKRMKLEQVFKNEFLSSDVASKYNKRLKNNKQLKFNARIFTGGKSTLSICLQNPKQQIKGQKILALNKISDQIDELDKQKEQRRCFQNKNQQTLQTEQYLFQSLDMISNFIKKKKMSNQDKAQKQIAVKQTNRNQLFNQAFKNSIQIYNSYNDKSELLIIISNKFEQIIFKDHVQQIVLLSKYAVIFVALLNFYQISFNMKNNNNFLHLDQLQFEKFKISKQYDQLKQYITLKIDEQKTILQNIKTNLKYISKQEQSLLKDAEILEFLNKDFQQITFYNIKNAYRKILRVSYDIVSKNYNQSEKQDLARLGFYIVYCLTVDKLYLENYVQQNFKQYFEWRKKQPSKTICLNQFQQYMNNADSKELIMHARRLLFTYFKNIKC